MIIIFFYYLYLFAILSKAFALQIFTKYLSIYIFLNFILNNKYILTTICLALNILFYYNNKKKKIIRKLIKYNFFLYVHFYF